MNNVYLRTNASNGVLFRYTDASSIPTTVTGTTWDWEYTPRIYYIRPNGNNIPSLYREKLEANAPLEMSAEELVEGIEDLNIM